MSTLFAFKSSPQGLSCSEMDGVLCRTPVVDRKRGVSRAEQAQRRWASGSQELVPLWLQSSVADSSPVEQSSSPRVAPSASPGATSNMARHLAATVLPTASVPPAAAPLGLRSCLRRTQQLLAPSWHTVICKGQGRLTAERLSPSPGLRRGVGRGGNEQRRLDCDRSDNRYPPHVDRSGTSKPSFASGEADLIRARLSCRLRVTRMGSAVNPAPHPSLECALP
jgi:hypothetical protein